MRNPLEILSIFLISINAIVGLFAIPLCLPLIAIVVIFTRCNPVENILNFFMNNERLIRKYIYNP